MPTPPLSPLAVPSLAAALLDVGSAATYEEFGQAAARFLRGGFDLYGLEIHLRNANREQSGYGYTLSEFPQKYIHGADAQVERGKLGFVAPYLASHARVPIYRGQGRGLPQGEAQLSRVPFYREFMKPEGWHDLIGMAFWRPDGFDSCIYINRCFDQEPFSDAEEEFLRQAYPFFASALRRLHLLYDERAHRANLEESLLDLPVATLLLGWNDRIEQANRAAARLCMAWVHGAETARLMKTSARLEIPREIVLACHEMKESWMNAGNSGLREARRLVAHPDNGGLQANITLLRPNSVRLSTPSFLVRITEIRRSEPERGQQEQILALLSPAERALLPWLGRGLTNKEIAGETGKSLQTVKNQVSSVLAKLQIPNRASLITLLRP